MLGANGCEIRLQLHRLDYWIGFGLSLRDFPENFPRTVPSNLWQMIHGIMLHLLRYIQRKNETHRWSYLWWCGVNGEALWEWVSATDLLGSLTQTPPLWGL